MSENWDACFQAGYAPADVRNAAQAVLSRQAEPTQVVELILLMDMISEIACKAVYDADGPKDIDVRVNSPAGQFRDIAINRTSQFAAFGTARKMGLLSDQEVRKLAEQSATASVVSQVQDAGEDPAGMIVRTVPLGFENFIRESLPKPGLLSRIMGKRT